MLEMIIKVWRWVADARWVASIAVVEGLVITVTEATNVLPDGSVKAYVLAVAVAVLGFVQQARAWSNRTVERLKEPPAVTLEST